MLLSLYLCDNDFVSLFSMEFWDSLVGHFHYHLVIILVVFRHRQRISTQLTFLLSCTHC